GRWRVMSATQRPVMAAPDGSGAPDGSARPRRGQPRRRTVVAATVVVVVLAGAGTGAALVGPFGGGQPAGGGVAGNGTATSLATVTHQSLSSRTSVGGTLGYAGSYNVTGHGGTITWLPQAGQVIGQGQVLYRVGNGTPVVLLYGRVPAWRALSAGGRRAGRRPPHRAPGALRPAPPPPPRPAA